MKRSSLWSLFSSLFRRHEVAPNQTSSVSLQVYKQNVGRMRAHLARFAYAQSGRLGQIARHALVPLLLDILGTRGGFHAHGGADGGGDTRGLQRGLALRGSRVGWVQIESGTHKMAVRKKGG